MPQNRNVVSLNQNMINNRSRNELGQFIPNRRKQSHQRKYKKRGHRRYPSNLRTLLTDKGTRSLLKRLNAQNARLTALKKQTQSTKRQLALMKRRNPNLFASGSVFRPQRKRSMAPKKQKRRPRKTVIRNYYTMNTPTPNHASPVPAPNTPPVVTVNGNNGWNANTYNGNSFATSASHHMSHPIRHATESVNAALSPNVAMNQMQPPDNRNAAVVPLSSAPNQVVNAAFPNSNTDNGVSVPNQNASSRLLVD